MFSIVFAGTFYWFYSFTREKAISQLKSDMRSTLIGASEGVDVDELMALYTEGKPNASGFSNDPRYLNQLAWLETVHSIEPRAWLYAGIINYPSNNRRVGQSAVNDKYLEMVYLVDLWANYDPSKAVKFLESDVPSSEARLAIERGTLVETQRIYSDKWGTWLSAFAPLTNNEGKIVAVLGLDIEADYVFQLQQAIRNTVLWSFGFTYCVLFTLIYVLSGIFTRQLTELTQSAEHIGAGNYDKNLSFSRQSQFPDEMQTLAQVFEVMIDRIRTREQLIKESKQAEDEIRHALQEQREINELKSRFVSMVSHELRTPLTMIRTATEIIERFGHAATQERKEEYFQQIRAAIRNMNQLLEDVLMIGKTEAGQLEFSPTQVNLEAFCREIVAEIRLGIGAGYTIAFNIQGEYRHACVDKKLLRSILTNLLSNAIKYSHLGSIVEFDLLFLEHVAVFEIRDHGIGIPTEDQPYLFKLFHRAKNVDTIRGTGLGLAIVKQCLTQHQGQITFTSEVNVGTSFKVTLPLSCQSLPV
ncbi:MAG: HAMP domain-containing histidine kinase [Cyanothece sp. SIO1E1]|nr:HAMP domain-containing histidine kinase [Cyanothece sp. SIO1E1]